MANGTLKLSARVEMAPTRPGVLLSGVPLGFDMGGITIQGVTKVATITISNLSTGTLTEFNLDTGDVTENGATSSSEGVTHEGVDLGFMGGPRFLAIRAASGNTVGINVAGTIVLAGELNPNGLLLVASPASNIGVGSMTFAPAGSGQGVIIDIWA